MNKIKFFYGLSGTFKTVTINSEKKLQPISPVVWSMIKHWKDLESGLFLDDVEKNHLNFALLHLCILGNELKSQEGKDGVTIFSERGVSDPLFYYEKLDNKKIVSIVEYEKELCNTYLPNCEIEKILLIQEDKKFIEDIVLKEPHRKSIFPDVESYIKRQNEYVDFTRKYNNITKVIKIDNAKEYLESLGLTFKKEG